jgi:hypothetical protein
VSVDAVIDISFGFEVSFSAVLTAFMEVLMESSFVFVTCVWCEVAFLRSLAGQLQSRREIFQLWKLSFAQESARGFDSPTPHQCVGLAAAYPAN